MDASHHPENLNLRVNQWVTVTGAEHQVVPCPVCRQAPLPTLTGNVYKVYSIELPFVALWDGGQVTTVDTRNVRLTKVRSRSYIDKMFGIRYRPPEMHPVNEPPEGQPAIRCGNCSSWMSLGDSDHYVFILQCLSCGYGVSKPREESDGKERKYHGSGEGPGPTTI